ncbi:MAG: DUF3168 domain-containing protein [Planctomycetaceae bacterium]|nr:MAG: DUF3168 domain-containing protein [Planctomycetaceae bacterium]
MSTIDDAIYQILTTNSGVVALASNRVYPNVLPQGVTYPAISFQIISETPEYSHEGDSNLNLARVQFDCYATTQTGVRAVADALRSALTGLRTTVDNVRIGSSFLVNTLSNYEDALRVYRMTRDFMMTYSV